jgi:hypothetical protein
MLRLAHRFAALAAVGIGVGACAGSGVGLDQNGRPLGSEQGGGVLTATFESIQDNVFTPICSVCHAGGAAPEGMRLDAANSYAMIVGVASVEVPSLDRIKPGDPDHSYLVQKIEGHAAVGAQMPFGGPPLPAATIATIRQWVSDGAPAASAAATSAGLAVTSVAPAPGEVVLEAPRPIVIAFNHALDATQLDSTSVRLLRVEAGLDAEITAVVATDLQVPDANPRALLVAPRAPLPNGRYRLVLPGAPAMGLADVGGARLATGGAELSVTDFRVEEAP